jgi:hypothetical protein
MAAWAAYKRKDPSVNKGPGSYFTKDVIRFNMQFVELASIADCTKVEIYVDEKNKCLGFSFNNKKTPDSLSLFGKVAGYMVSARGLYAQYPWIKEVTTRPKHLCKFVLKKTMMFNELLWVVQL